MRVSVMVASCDGAQAPVCRNSRKLSLPAAASPYLRVAVAPTRLFQPLAEMQHGRPPSKEILKAARRKVGQADVPIGGPPCQPFSKSGYWARGDALRLDDPRADTLTAYLRVLREPKTCWRT
jgi:site-specific DNA-cytosine methylase